MTARFGSTSLRSADNAAVRKVQALGPDGAEILIGDIILLEVLQGARDAPHAARIERNMRRFPVAPMLDAGLAVRAAQNYRFLRSRGITVRKTAGLIIGTFCMACDHLLLHNDRDFEPMAAHLACSLPDRPPKAGTIRAATLTDGPRRP